MSPRRIILIFIALIASGSTVLLGKMWLQNQRASMTVEQPVAKPKTQVLVAKGAIPAGQFVRPENLRWEEWPEDGMSTSYVVSDQHKLEDYVGAVARVGLADGEPITDQRVVRPGDRGFLAAVLEPEMRAVTVNVTPSSGLAGLVFPGDRVDLVATFKIEFEKKSNDEPEKKPRYASETALRNIRVLALDQKTDDQNKDIAVAKTATLEITPKQAEEIAVMSAVGQFSLSLRSVADDGDKEAVPPLNDYTWDSEIARMLPPPGRAAGKAQTISVVRGADAKEVDISGSMR